MTNITNIGYLPVYNYIVKIEVLDDTYDYMKTNKDNIKNVIKNKDDLIIINNLAILVNKIVIHALQFLKLYILYLYDNKLNFPKIDKELFKIFDKANIVFDEDLYNIAGPGWITQQIVKSSLWRLNICENYILIDSDSYFIRSFKINDFMYNDNIPYGSYIWNFNWISFWIIHR